MCLIIEQKRGDSLTQAEVFDIYSRNRDGFGAMWRDPAGKVRTWRGVPRDAAQAWEWYRSWSGVDCVLHWRMATHGSVRTTNAHPFTIDTKKHGTIAIVHNGIVPGYGRRPSKTDPHGLSDTAHYVDSVIRPIAEYGGIGAVLSARAALAGLLGGSVLVVAGDGVDGWHRIHAGPSHGVEWSDRWYSNTYAWSTPIGAPWYRPPVVVTDRRGVDSAGDTSWGDGVMSLGDYMSLWRSSAESADSAPESVDVVAVGKDDVCAYLRSVLERDDPWLADLVSDPASVDDDALTYVAEEAGCTYDPATESLSCDSLSDVEVD